MALSSLNNTDFLQQKANINFTICHSLERFVSRHTKQARYYAVAKRSMLTTVAEQLQKSRKLGTARKYIHYYLQL